MKKIIVTLVLGLIVYVPQGYSQEALADIQNKEYKEAAYKIIDRIKGLDEIFDHFKGVDENAKIVDDEESFWITFDYENDVETTVNEETQEEIKTFSEEQGIDVSLFFYKGEWQGTGKARPFTMGDLNVLVFVEGAETEDLLTIRSTIGQIVLDEKNNYEVSKK